MGMLEVLLCAVLLCVSAFFAASEVALFSLSRAQLRHFKAHLRGPYKRIRRLLSDPGGVLVTVLVGNEIVNIVLSSIIARNVNRKYSGQEISWLGFMPEWAQQTVAGMLITAPLILIFGEITPKGIATRINQVIAPAASYPLLIFYYALSPIRLTLNWIFETVRRVLGGKPHVDELSPKEQRHLKEEELLMMVEEGIKEGEIHQTELQLIRNVLMLDDQTVESIFTPIHQIPSLTDQSTLKQALEHSRAYKLARIPVLQHPERKQVVGILYLKDLLNDRLIGTSENNAIAPLVRKPLVVGPQMRLNSLFRRFKQTQTHLAIVQTGAGETLGIVTMDDVIESLFEGVLV